MIETVGGKGLFVRADVSREEDLVALVDRTVDHFGRLDIAFNNASVHTARGPITEITAENYEYIFGINVRGMAFSMKYQIAAMLKTGGGSELTIVKSDCFRLLSGK
jgi:NAD(P)-dependent dehydrogenase (short-subunit alcohol dehydrogenase family)